jgi:FixJ family two-component response regulator
MVFAHSLLCHYNYDSVPGKSLRRFIAFISTSAVHLAKNFMISIVDDDKSVREAAKMLIRSLGHTAATFASAEEFLESGQLRDTACVITDMQMPGMSGVDLQYHLAANGHSTPVIVITAYPEEEIRERALNGGAFGFLSKPFSEESLIACLDKALAHKKPKSAE